MRFPSPSQRRTHDGQRERGLRLMNLGREQGFGAVFHPTKNVDKLTSRSDQQGDWPFRSSGWGEDRVDPI